MTDPKITAQFIALKKALSTLVDATEKCVIACEALGDELYPDPGKPEPEPKRTLARAVIVTEKCVITCEALGSELYPDPGKPEPKWTLTQTVMSAKAFCDAEPVSVEQKQSYRDAGHSSRAEYLGLLATEYPAEAVYTLASMLGPSEDFDGLISALETIADFE